MPARTKADDIFDAAPDAKSADAIFDAAPAEKPSAEALGLSSAPEGWRTEADVPGLDPTSKLGAAQRGLTQGVTLGFGDELAGVGSAISKWLGLGDKGYVAGRNEARAESTAAKAAHPYIYGGTELAGSIAAPIPGMAATKPLQFGGKYVLTKAGQRALVGGLSGAAMGLGYGTADLADSSPEAQQRGGGLAGDVVPSAALGAVLGPLGGAAGDRLAIWLKQRAADNALKAIGLKAGISNALTKRGYESADEARKLGTAALDMDLIKPFGTAESVAKAASEAKPRYGAMIDDALAQADGPFDFGRAAWEATAKAHGPDGLTTAALAQSGAAARNVNQIANQAALDSSFEAANRLKSNIYEGINYANDPALKTKLQQKVAAGLRGSIEDQLAERAGPEAADQLRTANQRWGELADISSLAQDEATRQQARKWLTPLDFASAAMGGGAGHSIGGAGGGVAGAALPLVAKLLGPRMPSTLAVSQRALAPNVPGLAARAMQGIQNYNAQAKQRRQSLSPDEEAAVQAFKDGG